MNSSDEKFPVHLFGTLAIVAGVFIVLGGGCFFLFGMMLGEGSIVGFLGIAVGIWMIVGGARMVRRSGRQND